ncbi:hypothetical protein D9M70_573450 [compost metagenome]
MIHVISALRLARSALAVGRICPGFLLKTLPSVGRFLVFLCRRGEMAEALVLQVFRVVFEGFYVLL